MTTTGAVILATGLLVGSGATWIWRMLALRVGLVRAPNPLVPQHTRPIAHMGGIAVVVACGVVVASAAARGRWIGWPTPAQLWTLGIGALAFVCVGVLDDAVRLRAVPKLVWQVAAVISAVLAFRATGETPASSWQIIGAIVLTVAVVNAVNVTDVCDGLATSLSAVAFTMLAFLDVEWSQWWLTLLGVAAGFLVFNRPPATIFLGDTGSHLLGFFLSVAMLRIVWLHGAWPGAPMAVLAAAVFVFEAIFITVTRWRRGVPWWKGSPDHFALRLQAAGYSRWTTVASAWLAAALLAWLGARLPMAGNAERIAAIGFALTLGVLGSVLLTRMSVRSAPTVGRAPAAAAESPQEPEGSARRSTLQSGR